MNSGILGNNGGNIAKTTAGAGNEAHARQAAAVKKEPSLRVKKGGHAFEGALAASMAIGILALSYESLAEMSFPASSMLSALHSKGYLKGIPVAYEPGKGIWLMLGWAGAGMMALLMLYSLRKRLPLLGFLGSMRVSLNAHMFLGIMGPLCILFHTTFKFNGIIATSFWCMMVTMVFGILGRYIYIQIPRGITGAELGVKDIEEMIESIDADMLRHADVQHLLKEIAVPDTEAGALSPAHALLYMMKTDVKNRLRVYRLRNILRKRAAMDRAAREDIVGLLSRKAALIRRKNLLTTAHRLLHYWHVLHIPLAITMFLIMFIHIGVYYIFRPV